MRYFCIFLLLFLGLWASSEEAAASNGSSDSNGKASLQKVEAIGTVFSPIEPIKPAKAKQRRQRLLNPTHLLRKQGGSDGAAWGVFVLTGLITILLSFLLGWGLVSSSLALILMGTIGIVVAFLLALLGYAIVDGWLALALLYASIALAVLALGLGFLIGGIQAALLWAWIGGTVWLFLWLLTGLLLFFTKS